MASSILQPARSPGPRHSTARRRHDDRIPGGQRSQRAGQANFRSNRIVKWNYDEVRQFLRGQAATGSRSFEAFKRRDDDDVVHLQAAAASAERVVNVRFDERQRVHLCADRDSQSTELR